MAATPEFDYRKYLQLIHRKKRLFMAVALAIMTAAVVFCYLQPKKYQASSTVFIEKNVISELIKGLAITPSMDDTLRVLGYAITSRTLILKVMDDLDMGLEGKGAAKLEETVRRLQKNTSIQIKDPNLFIISFRDSDPRFARDFVNALVRRYIEENVSSKREESYGAIQFLSEQMGTFRKKLDKTEDEINQYKAEKGGLIAIDEANLFKEINTAQQKLYDIQLRRRQLEGLKPVTKMAADPLQTKLISLQKHLEELRVQFTDSYPEVIKVRSEIETLKEQMKGRHGVPMVVDPQEVDKVDAELNALRLSEDGLKRFINSNQVLLQRIPEAKAGLEKLETEEKSQKAIYDQLMSRHGQSEVSKQMEVQDKTTTFRIVDPAVTPTRPVSPNRVKLILFGIVAGVACGIGLIIALDYFNPSVKTVDAIKPLGLAVLAIVPQIYEPEKLAREWRRDLRLYLVAGSYFLLIVAILALEAIGKSPVDKIISSVKTML